MFFGFTLRYLSQFVKKIQFPDYTLYGITVEHNFYDVMRTYRELFIWMFIGKYFTIETDIKENFYYCVPY